MESKSFSDFISKPDSPKTAIERSAFIKLRLLSGEYSFRSKRGRSKVWDIFSKISDENGVELIETVVCKSCYGIYKFTGSTSNLVKHKCYIIAGQDVKEVQEVNVDQQTKTKATQLISEWSVKSGRSFKIIKDTGLKDFAKFLIEVGANFGSNVNVDNLLPKPRTISQNIKGLYESRFREIKAEVLEYKSVGYSVTNDIWTDPFLRSSYLSCNVHYIKDGNLVNRFLAIKSIEEDSCSGFKIKEKIAQILSQFGCDMEEEKPVVVTNRRSPIITAFPEGHIVFCVNYLLHDVIEVAIKRIPELNDIFNKCTKLIKFCEISGESSSLVRSLNTVSLTRSMKIYNLLKSVEGNLCDIRKILKENYEISIFEGINVSLLNSVVLLLEAFEDASKKLDNTKLPTIHLTIPYLENLKKKCQTNENDNVVILQLKSMLDQLLTSTVLENMTKYHKIALFLFPPTNKLISFPEYEKVNIIKECKEIMGIFLKKGTNTIKKDIHSYDNVFMTFIEMPKHNDGSDKIDSEIQSYYNINVDFSDEFDCFQWWNFHKNIFPLLYQTSCKIFSIPASCTASDNVFSEARKLITEKCSPISKNSNHINQIMFLNIN